MNVEHIDGAFIIQDNGKRVAETTYKLAEDVMTMPHTWVDESLRGKGVAKQLVAAAISFARDHHYKIDPVCPVVKGGFAKDPSIHDVLVADANLH
jgi:uncharacterized protein